jgi:hypothetical protein
VALPPVALGDWLVGHGGVGAILHGEGLRVHRELLQSTLGEKVILDPQGPVSPSALEVARLARSAQPFRKEALFALEPHYVRPFTSVPPRARAAINRAGS